MVASYYLMKMMQKWRSERESSYQGEHSNSSAKQKRDFVENGDYTSKCRACLDKGKIPIYGLKASTISEAIKLIADIDVGENSEFPRFLCIKCHSLLQGAMKFRKMVQQTNKILKEVKPELSLRIDDDDDEGEHYSDEFSEEAKPTDTELQQFSTDNNKSKSTHSKRMLKDNMKKLKKAEMLFEYDDDIPLESLKQKYVKEKVSCRVCKKQVTKTYYKQHLAVHGIGKPKPKLKVECKICNKTILKVYYKQHMSVLHKDEQQSRYVCDVCGKIFRFQGGYKSHVLTHTDEFPFKCQHCPYRGRNNSLLKIHLRVHAKDYRFQCTECPSRFISSGNMHKHMMKHKERQIKCEMCTRAFHTQILKDRHYQVDHLGIRNHICNICNKTFGYRKQMMKHQLKVHKREKFQSGRMPSYLEVELKKQREANILTN